jgi:hypothetical protein
MVPASGGNSSDICQATNRHPGQEEVPFTPPVAVDSMPCMLTFKSGATRG